jgi:hypothetical protein
MVDPDRDLAKEVRQLSGDIKELQIKLGILHRIMKNQGEAIREKIQPHLKQIFLCIELLDRSVHR